MRIAQISTMSAPVRKNAGGSVESLVWLLTREFTRLGHDVTVFGVEGGQTDGELAATLPGPYGARGSLDDWQVCEWVNLCAAVQRSSEFDILHSHAYLWGLPLEPFSEARMVHTTHIVPDTDAARLWSISPRSAVSALSDHQWSAFPHLNPAAVIPHGIDVADFTFRAQPEDYVVYLGRFVPGKGPCQAVAAARAAGVPLILAGPRNNYYTERVQPLVDGSLVRYVGPVNQSERDQLLGGARALLYPIQYPEAFGLVMVEAMLCGTPVAAMRLGAVPEIVDEGLSGFYADSTEKLPQAITRCFQLDRKRIRERAAERFNAERMAKDYLQLYERLLTKGGSALEP
jgi:glycosyltransferase involved in cell wall biosynthesis